MTIAATADQGECAYVAIDVTTSADDELTIAVAQATAQYERRHDDLQAVITTERSRRTALEDANASLQEQVNSSVLAQRNLEHSLARLGSDLSHTVHDVRAPLNTIIGFAELLHRNETDTDRIRWLEHIEAASEHILHTVNRLLQLARAESGHAPINPEELELRALVTAAAAVVAHEIRSRDIDMQIAVPSDAVVHADQHLLSHVLTNLLANAVAHSPTGGWVRVEADVHRSLVSLRIVDSGAGVPVDLIPTIFEPYRRDDLQPTRTGTGLGLAICREYVEAMEGSIGVENATGAGASFWVDLPRPETTAPRGPLILAASADLATLELLEVALAESWTVQPVRSVRALLSQASHTSWVGAVVDVALAPPEQLEAVVQQLKSLLPEPPPLIALSTGSIETPPSATSSIRIPTTPSGIARAFTDLGVQAV